MKEKYAPPEMEIVDIDEEDIIFASGGDGTEEESSSSVNCPGYYEGVQAET